MKLIDILKDLSYGELSGLAIGGLLPGEAENEPDPHEYERIIGYINLGLKEIYKRFFLRSVEIDIQQQAQISTYKLHSDYAQSNTASPIAIEDRYIYDTVAEPFQDDILKIEEIYDEEGNKMVLNDVSDVDSIYTPTFRSVQFPNPVDDAVYSIQYRACHPKIDGSLATDPEAVEVELPNSLHISLLQYVGYRANMRTNMEKASDYWQQFETSCAKVDEYGLEVQGEPGDWRFDDHGWV